MTGLSLEKQEFVFTSWMNVHMNVHSKTISHCHAEFISASHSHIVIPPSSTLSFQAWSGISHGSSSTIE